MATVASACTAEVNGSRTGKHARDRSPRYPLASRTLGGRRRFHDGRERDPASAALLGTARITRRSKANPKWKDSFHCAVGGAKAAGWLMTLYRLLGLRRKDQALAMLRSWRGRALHPRQRMACPRGHLYDGEEGLKERQRYCRRCRLAWRRTARARGGNARRRAARAEAKEKA